MSNKKREQFTETKRSKLPLIAGAAVVALAILVGVILSLGGGSQEPGDFFGQPVSQPRSYVGRVIKMTTLEPVIANNQIELSLAEIEENNIVYFEVMNDENTLVPLMAYITPSGRVFAGSSMCEPCRGRTFSLAGETLVCDACRTTYDIETHSFLSGSKACGSYPPVNMNPRVEDGKVIIDLQNVLNWRIRS